MENVYSVYCKTVQGQNYYFVKKFTKFPEFINVPDVMVGYGMHPNFEKACSIATIHEEELIKKLYRNFIAENTIQAKVVSMNSAIGENLLKAL